MPLDWGHGLAFLVGVVVGMGVLALVWWPTPRPKAPSKPTPTPGLPRIAIVIDDLGYNLEAFHRLLDLDLPLTFSILPHLPYSQQIAREAHARGREVLLHLPMEPENGALAQGADFIRVGMAPREVRALVAQEIQSIPYVVGVNNHMGSRATRDRGLMRVVLEEVGRNGLFFLDSRTTPDSVAYQVARELGVPAAQRAVFLDHQDQPEAIQAQLDRLIQIAREQGQAVAIGHPRPHTLAVLEARLPGLEAEGVQLVSLSTLVRPATTLEEPLHAAAGH